MKVKQTVEITADTIYCGWRGLEINDRNGDEVTIDLTDDQLESLYERLATKVAENRTKKLEKLREQLEEAEESADSN